MPARPARFARSLVSTATLFAAVAACATQTGCVQRRLTIRSSPPGAVVYVGNQEIGTTPISHDFIYYGSRDLTLVKDGFETLKVKAEIPAPWYDLPGIDFVSENLIPNEIRDHRTLDFQLQPQVIVPTEQLIGRAEELRRTRNLQATAPIALPGVAPASPSVVPVVPPGALPPGALPPGSVPPGAAPPGNFIPGATPPGFAPPGAPSAGSFVAPPSSVSPARPSLPAGPPPNLGSPVGPPPTGF